MNLPKELTPELLGLLLDMKIKHINSTLIDNGYKLSAPTIMFKTENDIEHLSIDTLTRLMKEWCWDTNNARISSGRQYGTNYELYNACIDVYNGHKYYFDSNYKNFIGNSEFEAVLKATEWIAKECKYF